MTAGEISGWPRHFLTIWLIEYWNWSWREFLVWPFSGKNFFLMNQQFQVTDIHIPEGRRANYISLGSRVPRGKSLVFFPNSLPWGICWVTTWSTAPPVSTTKAPGVQELIRQRSQELIFQQPRHVCCKGSFAIEPVMLNTPKQKVSK